MSTLSDKQIVELIEGTPPLLKDFKRPSDWYSQDSLVQPSSLDLHVGIIYIPPKEEPKPNDLIDSRNEYYLLPGQAVIVDTLETLELPSHIAAFGFPPTSISDRAILMTNPGHIDPGFRGKLSFTLINMGREAFVITKNRTIVTLLLNTLDENCLKDFTARNHEIGSLTNHDLYRLGRDFLDLDQRASKAAESAIRKENVRINRMQVWLPILAALISATVAFVAAYLQTEASFARLEQKQNLLENKLNFEDRIKSVETKMDELIKGLNNNQEKVIKKSNSN